MDSHKSKAILYLLFFVSGACTLIYELVWVRMLILVFGMSVFAISTVLTAFMAGLALGSFLFGRIADRRRDGLRTYAYLELGIGLFALVFPFVLSRLDELYTVLYRELHAGAYAFAIVRFVLVFLVLLIPTTLMGATFPVMSKFAVARVREVGRVVGSLYAINTFGAAAGTIAAAYFLMELVGTSGTTYVAAAANLLVAAVAFGWSRRRDTIAAAPREPATVESVAQPPTTDSRTARLVFWGFGISGFCALGYQIIWTRLLCMTLHITTIQSVSTILITFLLGLAAGGAVGARIADRRISLPFVFGAVQLVLGSCAIGSIFLLGWVPGIVDSLVGAWSWWNHIFRLSVVALGIMLLPTFLMGLLLPIAGKIHVVQLGTLGRRLGNVYAVNTGGAILGAFVTGFGLIPLLGTRHGMMLLAALNIAVGIGVIAVSAEPRRRTRVAWLVGLGVPALALVLLLPGTWMERLFAASQPDSELLFYSEDTAGTVTVHEMSGGRRLLRVNGAGEVPTDRASIRTFRLLGNLPLALHPHPEEVLVIAFGGGVTVSAVELHRPRRIDCVEVAPGVVDAARYFADYNHDVVERLGDGRIRLILDDGRNHVLRTQSRYDVIISDSTHPGTADSWVLYTEEFYGLCRDRLKPGGYVAQWLPLHGLAVDDYRTILRTFRSVFPHASLWLTKNYSILLATPEELKIDLERVALRLGSEEVRSSLAEVGLGDPVSFVATLALDSDALERYAGLGVTNTDNRPYLSFDDRSRMGTAQGLPVTLSLIPHMVDRLDASLVAAADEDRVRIRQRLASRWHCVRGQVALMLGDRGRGIEEYRRAADLDPSHRTPRNILRRIDPDGPVR